MKTLRRINVMSIGKIYATLGAIYGLIATLILDVALAGLLRSGLAGTAGAALGAVGFVGLPILGIVGGAILGFLFSVIGAGIYNFIAEAIGGVKFDISGKPLGVKKIDVASYVKVAAVFAVIIGLVLGIIVTFALPSLLSAMAIGTGASMIGMASGVALIGLPVLFLILGIIWAAIGISLFNFFVGKVGAVVVDISGKPMALRHINTWSYVRIAVLIGFVVALVVNIIRVGVGSPGGIGSIVASLVLNVIATLIFGYIGISLFNFVAARLGGIEVDLK